MSKIAEYNAAKGRERVYRECMERWSTPRCDKFGLEVQIKNTWAGYYGDSTAGGWPDEIVKRLQAYIQSHPRALLMALAAEYAAETEQAMKAAEDEAKAVISELAAARGEQS